ncbi:MAG: transposase [Pirellula sp.]
MGRPLRTSLGGYVYHVLCQGIQPKGIFRSDQDYEDFESVLSEATQRFEPRILAYCCLQNHWNLVLVPRRDGDLSRLIAWITITHSARWHAKPRRSTTGGLYERRFKSFPVQDDVPLLDVLQYVESSPIRTRQTSATEWRWSSAYRRVAMSHQPSNGQFLSTPPVALPNDWDRRIKMEMDSDKIDRIERSIQRGAPFGSDEWVQRTAVKMNLESTLRPRGRPRKHEQRT